MARQYGFALEINNTNLRVGKTNLQKLEQMISLALEFDIPLVETSDGHTYFEIGENDKVEVFLQERNLNGDEFLINRDDQRLEEFLQLRKKLRQQ